MTNTINISLPARDKQRIKKIAKRLSIDEIQYISVIVRDSVKIMEKFLYPKTVLHLEKSYVDNKGYLELKAGIKKGNNPTSNNQDREKIEELRKKLEKCIEMNRQLIRKKNNGTGD